MMFGFYPPPTQTFLNFVWVILLDYIIAFGGLGLSGIVFNLTGRKAFSAGLSAFAVTLLRYVCHIFSGVLIWGVYAEGESVLIYSLVYNGTYMIPEIIISTVVTTLIFKSKIIRKH